MRVHMYAFVVRACRGSLVRAEVVSCGEPVGSQHVTPLSNLCTCVTNPLHQCVHTLRTNMSHILSTFLRHIVPINMHTPSLPTYPHPTHKYVASLLHQHVYPQQHAHHSPPTCYTLLPTILYTPSTQICRTFFVPTYPSPSHRHVHPLRQHAHTFPPTSHAQSTPTCPPSSQRLVRPIPPNGKH